MPKSGFSCHFFPIFRLIDGQETLDELERIPVDPKFRPLKDLKILEVLIHANPIAAAENDVN